VGSKRKLLVGVALAAVVAGGLIAFLLRWFGSRQGGTALEERRAAPDPEALKAAKDGNASPRVGFQMDRLEEVKQANFKPVVEYLSYIQVQRGGGESLVFVRERDLSALASLAGVEREEFVDQFKRMGVLVSMN
jgi:putative component of toxin-antitoxin plasmid stabilization module